MQLSHSLVVCVHNALADVKLCLASIDRQLDHIDELVLIDDASDRDTREYLEAFRDSRAHKVQIIRTEVRAGYTIAANLGLKSTRGAFITLLNSDAIVSGRWASKTISAMRANPHIGVLGPLSNAASTQSLPDIKGSDGQTAVNALPNGAGVDDVDAFCEQASAALSIPYVPLVHGFCMTISRPCLETVGLFDELAFPLGYGEENDFCIRAGNAGFLLGIDIGSYVYHAKSKSYASAERIQLMNAGWEALISKHGKLRLVRAIQVMENQPTLELMRQRFRDRFGLETAQDVASPRGHLQPDVNVIAFYLPQFHPFAVNDQLWGKGFTEWTNVVRGTPRFPGHIQPKLPGGLGFYDLRLTQSLEAQARLMHEYGIHGACIYYYRLEGRRLMEAPTDCLLANSHVEMQFCYCWANESWTRAWDGASSDILLRQTYDDATFWGLVDDVRVAAKDSRYITLSGRPLLMIYQVSEIPNASAWLAKLRAELLNRTGHSFLIGTVYSHGLTSNTIELVDLIAQFPPHRIPRVAPRKTIPASEIQPFEPARKDYYESYDDVVAAALEPSSHLRKMALGLCPDWDNTPRRRTNAHTLVGSTPQKFRDWTTTAAKITRVRAARGDIVAPVLFVNAWNEWAEGAMLEPSERNGTAYLEALSGGLGST